MAREIRQLAVFEKREGRPFGLLAFARPSISFDGRNLPGYFLQYLECRIRPAPAPGSPLTEGVF